MLGETSEDLDKNINKLYSANDSNSGDTKREKERTRHQRNDNVQVTLPEIIDTPAMFDTRQKKKEENRTDHTFLKEKDKVFVTITHSPVMKDEQTSMHL